MHNLLSVGTCLKTHNLLPKGKEKKKLLYIYLNNNIKLLKSALIPARPLLQGWALSCLLTNCSLKPRTQVKVWKMKLMESHGFGGESLEIPAGKPGSLPFPLKLQIQSYVHIHKCVLGKSSLGQSLELPQFQQAGKQTKDKGLWIIYRQEPRGNYGPEQHWAQPHSSSVLPNL